MRIQQILENSTTTGSVATVAQPMMTQTRENVNVRGLKPAKQVMQGKAKKQGPYANSINEGKVKELSMDLRGLTDQEFQKKYEKTKADVRADMKKVNEDDLSEQDLIVVPGQGRLKRTGFVKHDLDKGEHEGETLKNSLHTIARAAMDLDKRLAMQSEFPEWVSEKIGAAKGMMVSVMDYLISSQEMQHDPDAMNEGSQRVDSIVTDALKVMKGPEVSDAVLALKRVLGDRAYNERRGFYNFYIDQIHDMYNQQGVAEGSEEDSYSNKFVQSQIDYYKKHLLSGNTGDQHRIRGSLMNYERIKNQRIKNNTWQEQGVAEGLNEDVGGNYLYHATGAAGLKGMLSSGSIRSATGPQTATSAQTTLPTVSITRDWNYASGGAGASNTSVGHDAILVLDRNAVENNFKTLGTSQSQDVRGQAYTKKQQVSRYNMMSKFKTDDPERQKEIDTAYRAPKAGGEFEEAVVVPKGSLPLKGTMVGFWVNPKSQLIKDPEVMNDPRRLELAPGGTGRFVKAQQTQGVAEEQHSCPHCGGEMVSEDQINEKKDACYYKVKSRYSVWPSAYASGALVKCRKSHGNWGNGSKNESSILEGLERADENLHQWFKEKWVRFGPDGKIRGACARGNDSEGKPKCLPQSKAQNLGKKGRASAASRKRREDPNPERSGKAINVNTKKK